MKRLFISLLVALCSLLCAEAQNVFSSEDDLKKQANKLFEDEEYVKAYPLYSQLLSLYTKDAQYNYRFGACLLYASSDKAKAIPYLEFAAKRQKQDVDKEVFFFLGKAYHLNYRFADAVKVYGTYKTMASSKQLEKFDVSRQIEMCENGKRLLRNLSELSVIEKKEMPETEFYHSYNLSEFNSKLIVRPEDLKTSLDKKKKEENVMYLSPSAKQLYFSSYGEDGKNKRDIYYVNRLPNGDLSKPFRANDVINTKYDEEYPFLHPNGKILYFCSKGHNSMGGYDIFKSEWNDVAQAWGKPVNMDFAINTPDDDILFITDSEEKTAYFSSRRESASGSVNVYKIALERKSMDASLAQNALEASADSNEIKKAADFLKSQASLEINSGETEITSVAVEETTSSETSATTSTQPVTNTDIIAIAFDDARETQKDANELRKNADAAQNLANQKDDAAQKNLKEADALMKSAETITNQDEKMAQIDKAAALIKEAEKLKKEVVLADNISNQLDAQAKAKQKQADAELKFVKEFETSIKSGANEKKINELLAQKEKLDKTNDSLETASNIAKQAEEKQTEASKSMAKYLDIQQDVEDLQSESKRLRSEAEKAKNDGVKQNLLQQAEEMEKEAEEKKKNADSYSAKAKELQSEADALKNNAAITSSVMQEIQTSQQTTTASTNTVTSTSSSTEITAVAVPETTTTSTTTTTSVEPLVIKSPYVDVFVKQMYEAEKKPKELEREEALAVIYQSWTDSLDAQITSLKSLLASTKIEEHKSQIQYKISELTSSVDDKRQRASDSRNKVDNLKLQESLAGISSTSPETTSTSSSTTQPETSASTTTASEENLSGEKNINAVFENKLKENEKITNEYEKKVKEQTLYEEWSAALYDESVKLKKDGKSGKAEDLDKASKAKQILAIQSSDKATQIKAENPQLAETANLSSTTETTTTQPETTSATTTQPETTSTVTTATQPETTSSTSVTETASTPTISSTTTSIIETISPTTTESTNQPINQSTLSTIPPESVKNKDEYTHFVALKNESDWAKKNAERQNQQANDIQKIADEQLKESERLSQQSTSTPDPTEKQTLLDKSAEMQKRSLKNQAKADSIKIIAKNSEAEANAKRTESELYLQSLDKSTYEEITSATGYKTSTQPETTSASSVTSAETTSQPTSTSTSSTESTTQPVSTTATTTVSETQPTTSTATSTTSTETTTQPVTSAVETATQPTTTTSSSESTTGTETITSSSTESSTQPSTTSSSTSSETSTQPVATSSSGTSSEMLKYYDALFDRIEISGSSYSASKPIPVDAPMPDGLIFKVQIGAFRNPIPQNLFKGIKPITAETTPQGMKRYTAGLFQKFSSASSAKKQVNDLGYRDAFVVAFFNGKRISMNEALAKAKESGEIIEAATLSSTAVSESTIQPVNQSTNIANATDVKNVSGLFYAIQIGVFSKPVTSAQLYNIAPLNSERTDNNLIRYTTGRFSSEQKANAAKKNIADKGISDAFVVAYYNGKRIGLQAAKNLIDSQGNEVISKEKQEYTFVPSDTTTSESSAVSLSAASNKGIIFKVQVGAYREQVPIEDANKLLTLSGKGIKTFKDDNGLLVYTVGEFSEYESANNLKKQVVSEGITGAFVIAFRDGKKLSASEALDLIGNR